MLAELKKKYKDRPEILKLIEIVKMAEQFVKDEDEDLVDVAIFYQEKIGQLLEGLETDEL